MSQRFSTDILVIGGGAAGLSAALHLAEHARVTVLSKGGMESSSSHWAQGGVAAVTDPEDSLQSHVEDTLTAGAGLCDRDVVEFTVAQAPGAIAQLTQWGVAFDQDHNEYHLTREGGHSYRRILHVRTPPGAPSTIV